MDETTSQNPPSAEAPQKEAPPARKKSVPWGLLIVLGLVLAGVGTCAVSLVGALPKPVPSTTVLEIDLEQPVVETGSPDPISAVLQGEAPRLRDLVGALDRAAKDERVVGLVARIGGGGHGMAVTQELRDAVKRFRSSGKLAVAYAETFGEAVPGQGGYYLATAFDSVWVQPSGDVGFVGLAAETPFLRGTLEKIGVEPRFSGRKEYKTFINQYTERELTEPHRESLSRILDSHTDQIVAGVAEGRGLEESAVRALLAAGPYTAEDALEKGLVDAVGYRDEVLSSIEKKVGRPVTRLFAQRYLERAGPPHRGGAAIGLVYAVGGVARGESSFDAVLGGATMGSDTVSAAIRAAVRDDDVKAIVLRIDSPGGSYVASDTIRREVERARKAGKPVVASMGNVAASGGYFVAMDADRIVAQPGTLTGSIGVGGGKMALEGLWEKLGVAWGRVETTPGAGMFSLSRDFTPEEWARFEAWLDHIYADFVAKAAAGRKMSVEQMDLVARGRVWTGADAKERGLVDELGGLGTALRVAKELAGLPADGEVELRSFPPRLEPLEALLLSLNDKGRENSDSMPGAARARVMPDGARSALQRLAAEVAAKRDGALLLAPELWSLARF